MPRYLLSSSLMALCGACLSASEVRVWGSTNIADYTPAQQAALYTVPAGLTDVIQVAVCDKAIAALRATGEVVVWGAAGQPTLTVPTLARSGVTQISASVIHAFYARRSDGTVVAWGNASLGMTAVPVGLTNVVKVHGGGVAAIAIKADGSVVGWGTDYVNAPVGFTCQDAYPNAVALQANGTLSHWNSDPSTAALNIPAGLTGAALFTSGNYIAGVVSATGSVTVWGPSGTSHLNVPAGLSGIEQLAFGNDHVVARAATGTLTMWGDGLTQEPEMAVPPGWAGCQAIATGNRITAAVFIVPPNGSAPTGLALSGQTVVYQADANSVIGTLSATDTDPGDRQAYALVAGSGSTDNPSCQIIGLQLKVGSTALTAPANSTLSVRVRVTDSGGLTAEKAFSIAVGSAPAPAESSDSKGGILNGCGIGSGMAAISALLCATLRFVVRKR